MTERWVYKVYKEYTPLWDKQPRNDDGGKGKVDRLGWGGGHVGVATQFPKSFSKGDRIPVKKWHFLLGVVGNESNDQFWLLLVPTWPYYILGFLPSKISRWWPKKAQNDKCLKSCSKVTIGQNHPFGGMFEWKVAKNTPKIAVPSGETCHNDRDKAAVTKSKLHPFHLQQREELFLRNVCLGNMDKFYKDIVYCKE